MLFMVRERLEFGEWFGGGFWTFFLFHFPAFSKILDFCRGFGCIPTFATKGGIGSLAGGAGPECSSPIVLSSPTLSKSLHCFHSETKTIAVHRGVRMQYHSRATTKKTKPISIHRRRPERCASPDADDDNGEGMMAVSLGDYSNRRHTR